MGVRYTWFCRKSLPHLGIEAGDCFVYEPASVRPYQLVREMRPDPGAVLAADLDGALEFIGPRPPESLFRRVLGVA